MRICRLAACGILLLIVAACQASSGTDSLSAKQLEKKISGRLDEVGAETSGVDCREPLQAKVDATATCSYEAEGITHSVKATATKIMDDTISFDLKESIVSASRDLLETQVTTKSSEQQLTPSSVDCPKPLLAKNGDTATCTVIANDLKYAATLTAHDVSDTDIPFTIKIPPPAIVPGSTLEAQVAKLLTGQIASGIDSVSCADELEGTIGKSVECTLTSEDGKTTEVVVTIDQADLLTVHFNIVEK